MIWDAYPPILLGIDSHCLFLHVYTCSKVLLMRVPWNIYTSHGRCWEFQDCAVVHPTCCSSAEMFQHTKCWYESQKDLFQPDIAPCHRQAASLSTTAMSILHVLRDCIKRAAPNEDDNQSLQRHSHGVCSADSSSPNGVWGYPRLTAVKLSNYSMTSTDIILY